MGYREIVQNADGVWQVSLSTHLRTDIPNETTAHDAGMNPQRRRAEARFDRYRKRLDPVSGYNCFGCVFASKRTAIYDGELVLVALEEDGYLEVPRDEGRVGDVVVYFDAHGVPFHAARICSIESAIIGVTSDTALALAVRVTSKFDDRSGEYEHSVDDHSWNTVSDERLTVKLFRERGTQPRRRRSNPDPEGVLDASGSTSWRLKIRGA